MAARNAWSYLPKVLGAGQGPGGHCVIRPKHAVEIVGVPVIANEPKDGDPDVGLH